MSKKQVIGLDIGNTAVRASEVLTRPGGAVELVRYDEEPLPASAVRDGEIVDQSAVVGALRTMWARTKFGSKDVVIGVGSQHVAVRPLQLPRQPLAELHESLPFQVQESLPMAVEDAVLGYLPTAETITPEGAMFDGMLVAASRMSVMATVQAVEAAGLRPVQVDLAGFAVLRSLARGMLSEGTTAFVDLGARQTTIVVSTDGAPRFVRTLPTGVQDLTDTFARASGMPLQDATLVMSTRGLTVMDEPEHHAARGPLGEAIRALVDGIRNSIGFYAQTNREAPVTTVVLAGGGASVRGLGQTVATETRTRTVLGNPLEGITVSAHGHGAEQVRGRESTMGVSLGLGMGSAA